MKRTIVKYRIIKRSVNKTDGHESYFCGIRMNGSVIFSDFRGKAVQFDDLDTANAMIDYCAFCLGGLNNNVYHWYIAVEKEEMTTEDIKNERK